MKGLIINHIVLVLNIKDFNQILYFILVIYIIHQKIDAYFDTAISFHYIKYVHPPLFIYFYYEYYIILKRIQVEFYL